MIVALAGGVGAARFLEGLVRIYRENDITVISIEGLFGTISMENYFIGFIVLAISSIVFVLMRKKKIYIK